MKRILFVIPFIAGISLSIAQDVDLEDVENKLKGNSFTPAAEARILSLEEAISYGLRKNSLEKVRAYEKEIIELNWKDAFEGFWFPELSLNINTSGHHVESLYNSKEENLLSETPSGFAGLEFEEYTLFNWGRD
ncbi:MAG: hypothetical protein KC478_17570, partial [Bacteriovoracaceae bacterium]|nr:hypothetical protein [Bacteriovoracaceae bacterium]